VCQEDVFGGYSLGRSSREMFANYKRLSVKPLILFVNEKRVLLNAKSLDATLLRETARCVILRLNSALSQTKFNQTSNNRDNLNY